MVDVSELQGYLMKEKSKTGILHGLTGDINKRFFKVQKIESSDELALCYYKASADPEVRGWIYLKDMTEIAEDQDTMILTSVARTLHLYAQTRAEHNVWVTGLAKLCPEAFIKLGRNASLLKEADIVSTMPTLTKAKSAWSSGIKSDVLPSNGGVHDDPTASSTSGPDESFDDEAVSPEPQVSGSADDASSRSSDERADRGERNRSQKRGKSNRGNNNSGSGHQTVGHTTSWSTATDVNNVGGRGKKSRAGVAERRTHDRHRSLQGDARPQSSFSVGSTRSNAEQGECASDTESGKSRQRSWGGNGSSNHPEEIDEQGNVVDHGVRYPSGRTNKGVSTDGDSGDEHSVLEERRVSKHRPPARFKSAFDDEGGIDVEGRDPGISTRSRRGKEEDGAQLSPSLRDVSTAGDAEDTDGGIHVDQASIQSELAAAQKTEEITPDNVETIDLNESSCHTHTDTANRRGAGQGRVLGQTQEEREDNVAHIDEHKCSNQDEERDREQSAEEEVDASSPPVEIITWDGPRQGKSATSRLHRHISGTEAEAMGLDDTSPPKKEFLTNGPLRPLSRFHHQEEDSGTCDGRNPVSVFSKCEGLSQSVRKGRRRSAADLEWNEGEESRDRPRRLQDKLTLSANHGPLNLGDSEDDGEGELDLEVEKQRRRANAAILALEAAAKEADEGAQAEIRTIRGDCKPTRDSEGGFVVKSHREASSTVPLPAGPPPATRKGRRGHGVPPSRIAPPKLSPPARSKPPNRRTNSDNSFVHDNWDD